ncbi:piggyBac transposable element-derived protein 2-like isoform X3 [Xyrichtys novacula]|uniref:PiggyBac transposable element-derived protein 2-like isoform X3 n=1 Tax=Xyrichtys novacula TaxID=13765 RepID=A0AAV1HC00_XYRNO|nr:piggyBac transposable element-derived protein 2-like isoform X3 [Xyrichtys novacula]
MGIPSLGTVQQNCLGRGTFEEQEAVDDSVEIRTVKWVIAASTFACAQPVSKVERWDRKLKQKVFVKWPNIIKFMGGVDALDARIASYHIHIRVLSQKTRWPPLDVEMEFENKKRRGPTKTIPTQEIQFDAVASG